MSHETIKQIVTIIIVVAIAKRVPVIRDYL